MCSSICCIRAPERGGKARSFAHPSPDRPTVSLSLQRLASHAIIDARQIRLPLAGTDLAHLFQSLFRTIPNAPISAPYN